MATSSTGLWKSLHWRAMLLSLANSASLSLCHRSPLAYARAMRKCHGLYREYGFLPDEAMMLGLYDFRGNISDRYVSKARMVARQKVLNHASFQEITEDKALFYVYCDRIGVPIPKLLALFFKRSSGLDWGRQPLMEEAQWADFFDARCPNEFVVKPSRGVYGDGIVFVDKTTPDFSGAALYRTLMADPQYDSFVVQECLHNHPAIMDISPKKGLQTLRLITFIDKNLEVTIVHTFFKIIVGDNRVDNHKNGLTGNLLCEINLHDGSLQVPILLSARGPVQVPRHPDTSAMLAGLRLPFWAETCELARNAAPRFLPMRSIGWDIAVTDRGVIVVEANARYDPPHFGTFGEQEVVFKTTE